MQVHVIGIVLAAGSGERFGGAKQYALLRGERLVDRAIRTVTQACGPPILVLPDVGGWSGPPTAAVVVGGSTRTESVRNAMAAVPEEAEAIVVHDVARPLASAMGMAALVAAVDAGADAAVPVWDLPDTVKQQRGDDGGLRHVGREGYVVAQSPMAFRAAALRQVFATYDTVPIEESIAVERLGGTVVGVPGDRWSPHVVEPRDLEMVARLLSDD